MSFARIAGAAAIFICLPVVCATAKPIAATADTNLRKSPGTKSEVLTLIPKGTTVEVGKCSNGWCKASLNGQDGYVIAQNLGMARTASRARMIADEEVVEDDGPEGYGPPPGYVVGPPVYDGYYGYGPYYGYGWGWGRGYRGWGRRW